MSAELLLWYGSDPENRGKFIVKTDRDSNLRFEGANLVKSLVRMDSKGVDEYNEFRKLYKTKKSKAM